MQTVRYFQVPYDNYAVTSKILFGTWGDMQPVNLYTVNPVTTAEGAGTYYIKYTTGGLELLDLDSGNAEVTWHTVPVDIWNTQYEGDGLAYVFKVVVTELPCTVKNTSTTNIHTFNFGVT